MTCVSCGAAIVKIRPYDFRSATFRALYADEYVYKCTGCSLRQANVSKVDETKLTSYYRSSYRTEAKITSLKSDADVAYYENRARAILSQVKKHHQGKINRIFELGAGYGFNLKACAEAFPSAELLTDEIDFTVQHMLTTVSSATLEDGPYDVVILSHVLEHFTDPACLIRRVERALNCGGIIVIEVPNDVDGIISMTWCDEPHMTFFERGTMTSFLSCFPQLTIAEIFEAGPSYQRIGLKTRIINGIKYRLPRMFEPRMLSEFSKPNKYGKFLRLTLHKGAKILQ